ncbi:MAG TPA: V-type ATP synthase subunit E [Firmicutes bacterium]|nr:V-type ATP synthase subunit E [Bacillota bacterium]
MSGAEKLKEKIIAEAEAQAKRLLEEARQRADTIVAHGEREGTSKKDALLAQARAQAEERKRRALTITELDARKQILAAKEELIEDTFNQALARLQALDREKYRELVFPMILAAVQRGDEEIIVSPEQKIFFDASFMEKLNTTLRQQGKKGEIALSGTTRLLKGGFVLQAGEVEINNSFDSLLRMQRDLLEPAVAGMLFAE